MWVRAGARCHSAELAPDSGTFSCVNLSEVPRLSALTCEAEMVMMVVDGDGGRVIGTHRVGYMSTSRNLASWKAAPKCQK